MLRKITRVVSLSQPTCPPYNFGRRAGQAGLSKTDYLNFKWTSMNSV
jgi:hypothetical protein